MYCVYVHILTLVCIGPADESETFTHELRGVIPRSFEYLFSLINREKIRVYINVELATSLM